MAERLTDDELESIEGTLRVQRQVTHPDVVDRVIYAGKLEVAQVQAILDELRARRSMLSGEEVEALAHARVLVNAADGGDVGDEPLRARALSILDRLIANGGGV